MYDETTEAYDDVLMFERLKHFDVVDRLSVGALAVLAVGCFVVEPLRHCRH